MWIDCPHGLGIVHLVFDLFWFLTIFPLIWIGRIWFKIKRGFKK